MTSQCVTAIKGRMMRVIKLDTCGNPVTGAGSSMVISNGFVSIKPDPQYEDGTEFTKRVADGTFCVNQKDAGQLKRLKLTTMVCTMDPDMMVLMSGARLLSNGATGTGGAWGDQALVNNHYSLEVWQDVAGLGACNAAGQQQYVYWAFPNVFNNQLQSWMIELATLEFSLTSETGEVGTRWGTGTGWSTPWLGTNSLQPGDHFAYNVTTVPPPVSACGAQALAG